MKDTDEIPLHDWAASKNVRMRTAQQWAKDGLIPAKKKKLPVTVTLKRLVKTYAIPSGIKVPE